MFLPAPGVPSRVASGICCPLGDALRGAPGVPSVSLPGPGVPSRVPPVSPPGPDVPSYVLSRTGCPLGSGTPRGCPVPFSLPSVPLCPFVPLCPAVPCGAVQTPQLLPVMPPVVPGPCRARAGVTAPGTPWAVRGSLPPGQGCYQPREGWPGCDKGQHRAELWDGAALGCPICPQHPPAPGIVLRGFLGWKRSIWGGQRAGGASLSLPPPWKRDLGTKLWVQSFWPGLIPALPGSFCAPSVQGGSARVFVGIWLLNPEFSGS